MADFFIDLAFKKALRAVLDKTRHPDRYELVYWRHITQQLIRMKGPIPVINMVINSIEAVSDAEYANYYYSPQQEMVFVEDKPIVRPSSNIAGKRKQRIDAALKISDVAVSYGLKIKKAKKNQWKVVCPFHDDTDPSLSLSDEKNVFYCFGCHAKGDLIEFARKMEGLKEDV